MESASKQKYEIKSPNSNINQVMKLAASRQQKTRSEH